MTRIIFLRHANTQKDPSINATLWHLSEKGKIQAEEISKLPLMDTVDIIYASEEPKTFLTAEPLAKRLDKKVHLVSYFNEVKRGDKFLTKEEFEIEKTKQLINLDCHAFGGESGIEALARFKEGVKWVVSQNQGKTILIVTHGTVLNIYFADLLNIHEGLLGRWQKAAFCAYGIVENGKVVKDII